MTHSAFGATNREARVIHSSALRPVSIPGSRLRFVVDNMPDAEIRSSGRHGHGLFALRDFVAGDVLGTLDGQRVDWASFDAMQSLRLYGEDGDDLFMEWNALSPQVLLIRPFRTKYSFINHNRAPNAELAQEPLRVVAARAISAGEEVTLDYRREPLRPEYLAKATYL